MKKLSAIPPPSNYKPPKTLTTPQLRVLRALCTARGPISRNEIARRTGNKGAVAVGRAIGYEDALKRATFEQSRDGGFRLSLLTLGYVLRVVLDVDGLEETGYLITPAGRKAVEEYKDTVLPPIREEEEEEETADE